jgi:DNA-binding transcriptional regulator WhiA
MPTAAHCRTALAAALALYGRKDDATFSTQRAGVARLFWALLEDRKTRTIRKVADSRLRRLPAYQIEMPRELWAHPPKPTRRCDRIADVRGAFLACGSLSAASLGYHLEFVLPNEDAVQRLRWMLRSLVREPKATTRKKRCVLYYKDFETITAVLSTIGAFAAVLRLEDVRALKETKNRIHRLVNSEAANLERATAAAATQRRTIEFIADAYGLRKLPRALREIADLRLAHPDETLAELGRRCNPPASKSAVNSRLVALSALASRVRGRGGRASVTASGKG